jgi:UDP-N-acetylglucosamine 4,6-dehydratase/5-epimerase
MKKILITGGTGFLGRALAVKLKTQYAVTIAGRNNTQNSFAQMTTGCPAIPLDVSSFESVKDAFNAVKPDIVIHAAATKFVDISEREPNEAVDINVLGSQHIARIAIDLGCESVIGISTDKAAPPVSNTYALTKALMERMYCALDKKSDTRFACVRFGNIAWSSGSVFPIWKKMASLHGKIETTGPHMRRYLISVDGAADLVIRAMNNLQRIRGGIIIQDMKALQMEDMLSLFADQLQVPWEKISPRPGEREDEYLLGEPELRYSQLLEIDGIRHYLFTPNQVSDKPVNETLSTLTATRFTKEEMLELLKAPEQSSSFS